MRGLEALNRRVQKIADGVRSVVSGTFNENVIDNTG